MSDIKLTSLPITGMDCANCATAVERNIKKLPGVNIANVNLTTERAAVEYDTEITKITEIVTKIKKAGYGIAVGEADLLVENISDGRDGNRLEQALNELEGVISANLNWVTGKTRVQYIPTILSQIDIRKQIKKVGFEALILGDQFEDTEGLARDRETKEQKHFLSIGLLFTIPLFALSMSRDFGLLGAWAHQACAN